MCLSCELQVFTDTVEDDNLVVDGETDDGQHRRDDRGAELTAGNGVRDTENTDVNRTSCNTARTAATANENS